ncbi:hypothetical protein CKY47_16870 [Saccharothrix yanglingensis]|uniref:Uncharacterized protein n=1 Tax=Saccharothrix yanglingensis TaxID=659496 RepID=A0ABU0X0K3_9PSEU|nr:hypothetical protein [Saccharothrix yanglingensis]
MPEFAADLGHLRDAAGRTLPNPAVTTAYVRACGDPVAHRCAPFVGALLLRVGEAIADSAREESHRDPRTNS